MSQWCWDAALMPLLAHHQAPLFGLQPMHSLSALPKLGTPLFHCPSCSPTSFPPPQIHPLPPQLLGQGPCLLIPGETKSASVFHEGTVITPNYCCSSTVLGRLYHCLCFQGQEAGHTQHTLYRASLNA